MQLPVFEPDIGLSYQYVWTSRDGNDLFTRIAMFMLATILILSIAYLFGSILVLFLLAVLALVAGWYLVELRFRWGQNIHYWIDEEIETARDLVLSGLADRILVETEDDEILVGPDPHWRIEFDLDPYLGPMLTVHRLHRHPPDVNDMLERIHQVFVSYHLTKSTDDWQSD